MGENMMKYIRRFNESIDSSFTRSDIRWIKDCMVEIQDMGYDCSILMRRCVGGKRDIIGVDFAGASDETDKLIIIIRVPREEGGESGSIEYVSILDLGEEFMGRLFGMMKDNHNATGVITIKNECSFDGHSYDIKDYDNLDFLFGDDHKIQEPCLELGIVLEV